MYLFKGWSNNANLGAPNNTVASKDMDDSYCPPTKFLTPYPNELIIADFDLNK